MYSIQTLEGMKKHKTQKKKNLKACLMPWLLNIKWGVWYLGADYK